jgi:choline dehydrogenase-like flavoprotein
MGWFPRLNRLERELLLDLGRRVMPAGEIFPEPDEAVIDRLERLLADAPPFMQWAVRAAANVFDQGARLSTLATYRNLAPDDRQRYLDSWTHGNVLKQNLVRILLIWLKLVRYADPDLYDKVGSPWGCAKAAKPNERWRKNVCAATGLEGTRVVEADVVVVGSGAGGAVVACELARKGLAVAIIEEGSYFTRADFTGRPMEMQRKLYRQVGMTVTLGNTVIYCPVGCTVGGTTTVNSGTCLRVPEERLDRWSRKDGLGPFAPAALKPRYEQVEKTLGIAPVPERLLGPNALAVAAGAAKLGLPAGPLPRNAPDCDASALCPFGCPTDAKRSMNVSYIPMALRAGAHLYTGLSATRILMANGRAEGVVAMAHALAHPVTFKARSVVVAGGALLSPLLLRQSGLAEGSGCLGRHLSLHPSGQVAGIFDREIDMWKGVPQGFQVTDPKLPRVRFQGVSVPLELASAMVELVGPELTEFMESYRHLSTFGFMIDDTSRGQVLRQVHGWPLVWYWLNWADFTQVRKAILRLAELYFEAGARTVITPVRGYQMLRSKDELGTLKRARYGPCDVGLGAFHPLGTCRMGRRRTDSVVNEDFQVWGADNVYVVDGAVFPGSPGVNPQITIMALALGAAQRISDRYA